jgi:uncharacterized protein (DUF488 family)
MPEKTVWTIGHSTQNLEDFIHMLTSCRVVCIADIRSLPGSRRYPQFNRENLEVTLPQCGFRYVHIPGLGGRRKVQQDSKNTAWHLDAFRGYADYMETPEFKSAIDDLQNIAIEQRTAYMCAESLWWRCHRSLVSDYLKWQGWKVLHIMGIAKTTEHTYTQPAKIIEGKLNYEGPPQQYINASLPPEN